MKPLGEWLKQAFAAHQQGQFAEAEKLYGKVLKADAHQFDALHLLGVLKHQRGENGQALDLIARALNVNPQHLDALLNYGSVLSALGRHAEALAVFDKVLAADPRSFRALNNRGNALAELKRLEEALSCFDKALGLSSSNARTLVNRGNVLMDLGRYEEAVASYNRALALTPDDVATLSNCGKALAQLNRFDDALGCFNRALQRQPGNPDTLLQKGVAQLTLGNFAEGWAAYQARWRIPTQPLVRRTLPQPQWNGGHVKGTLLIWGEQGLGEDILYSSMIPDAARFADTVLLELEPRLVPLMARSYPDIRVIGRGAPLPHNIAAHSPLGNIGQYLRRSWEDFPRREHGYLITDSERAAALRERVSPHGEIVVGLSWVSKNPSAGQFKTAQLRDLESLLRFPGCRYVDLQYGDTLAERAALTQQTGLAVERLEDIDNTNDLDGLAALIGACDLIVTVSNTTAHLAGALGKPTWVFVPCGLGRMWHWFTGRDDSPWYPRVRIKRQAQGQSWKDTFAAAADEISHAQAQNRPAAASLERLA